MHVFPFFMRGPPTLNREYPWVASENAFINTHTVLLPPRMSVRLACD